MQVLHNAGLALADDLVAPSPSNPDGHFEDRAIIALHDDMLAAYNRRWHTSGTTLAPKDPRYEQRARDIIARYERRQTGWGFKDPRTCFFLQWWHRLLPAQAVIVVYRDYLSCYRSLRARQAQQLAYNPRFHQGKPFFWSDPLLPLQLWLDHNQALLAYIRNHTETTLVVSHDGMLAGIDLVSAANERFALALDASQPTGIRQRDPRDPGPMELPTAIPPHLQERLNHTLQALDGLSQTHRSSLPRWVQTSNSGKAAHFDRSLQYSAQLLGIAQRTAKSALEKPPAVSQDSDLGRTASVPSLIAQLDALRTSNSLTLLRHLTAMIEQKHAGDVALLLNAGKALLALDDFAQAEKLLLKVRKLAPGNPQALLHLALLARNRGQPAKAAALLQAALAQRPGDAGLSAQLGNLLRRINRHQAASALVQNALEHASGYRPLQQLRINLVLDKGLYKKAIEFSRIALRSHPRDAALYALLASAYQFAGKPEAALAAHLQSTLARVQNETEYVALIHRAVEQVPSLPERSALQQQILQDLATLAEQIQPGPLQEASFSC